jgi:hypothetical protein
MEADRVPPFARAERLRSRRHPDGLSAALLDLLHSRRRAKERFDLIAR